MYDATHTIPAGKAADGLKSAETYRKHGISKEVGIELTRLKHMHADTVSQLRRLELSLAMQNHNGPGVRCAA